MRARLPGIILVGVGLWLILTGCDNPTARASARNDSSGGSISTSNTLPAVPVLNLHRAVFDAVSLPGVGAGMITIETDLPAEIDVVTYPLDEVGLDYLTQGADTNDEQAAAEAHRDVAVTLERVAGGALIWARLLTPEANQKDSVKLHVRIPRDASLVIKATKGGNVTVTGEVSSVHTHTAVGTITVRGVIGPAQLTTENGSINVDGSAQSQPGQMQRLELHARNGAITLYAVGANVMASTTAGDIRFVGSLYGHDNYFSTTDGGQVLLTMPNNLSYRYKVESRGSVINDIMPAALICAMISNANNALRTNSSPDVLGKIKASDTLITPTYTFEGVAGLYPAGNLAQRPYLYFQTNHSQITRYSPVNDGPPNGGNSAQAWWPPECDAIKQQAQPPNIGVKVDAGTGTVTLRLIRKH